MFLILFLSTLVLVYFLLKRNYGYWKSKNIPGPKPTFLFGNIGKSFIKQKSAGEIFTEIYRQYDGYPFVGLYRVLTPCLLMRDPEFIKSVVVTNFKNFAYNEIEMDKKIDPLLGRNAFVLRDEEWKKTRHVVTPCFTASKMKSIFPLIEEVAKNMVDFITKQPEISKEGLECKELCTKFTIDNVASCAFGIEGKCFVEPLSEFRDIAIKFLNPGSFQAIKLSFSFIIPSIAKFLNIKYVDEEVERKLFEIVKDTIKYREENNIIRQDFLHMMNQLRYSSNDFTLEDVTAQAAGFFGDGYETSSNVMSFVLFNLASNPNVQEKLRREINKKIDELGGNFSYDAIQEMDYLEACIYESLRTHPVMFAMTKMCTKTFTYRPANTEHYKDISVTVEPGTTVIIPNHALYSDPKHFPAPHEYSPDRFMKDGKKNTNDGWKNIYKPFGDGPRVCLGQRFGLLQIKVGVAYIVKNYKMKLNQKTKLPLTYDPWYILISPIGGLWVNFEKI